MVKGSRQWLIPDCYIPEISTGDLISHESICLLNIGYEEALVEINVFFEDREPIEGIVVALPGRRTKHVRTSTLHKEDEHIPVGVPYAVEVKSDIPIFVQYSRLDSTQPANALMTTMAYPAD
ncbi:sensory rhodopsin transducer [Paenibacillus turpanensis]|uniref:sensory rhodopsin transducer n=1 Tax=Paenibacillus turpanensis TaxID=2689078 RepID=UPI00140D39EE|nr:sensory rhodopsin transducer [Paenibacillus turpanensis]